MNIRYQVRETHAGKYHMIKKVTIKDIARIAGVTPATVSMALNNRPRIGAETRKKIIKIAGELDYQPDLLARSLICRKSYTIGLVITNIADPFFPELAQGIEEKADELGYSVIICNMNRSMRTVGERIETLRGKGVDGIICATALVDDSPIRKLVDDHFPFVLLNRRHYDPDLSNKIDYVVLNNFSGGYSVVKHLYHLGHNRIAQLAGHFKASTVIERNKGALQAMKDCGIKQPPRLTIGCEYSFEQAHDAAKKLLKMKRPPTAIFSHDDYMALGAREAVLEMGLRIPEDIALVGFDDINTASLTGIDLTTISQKKYEMGELGVKILVEKLEKAVPQLVNHVVLKDRMVIRKSCGYHLTGYVR